MIQLEKKGQDINGNTGQSAPFFCPNCKTEYTNMKFCPECGSKLVSKPTTKTCPNCHAEVSDAKFCPECGTKIVSNLPDKNTPIASSFSQCITSCSSQSTRGKAKDIYKYMPGGKLLYNPNDNIIVTDFSVAKQSANNYLAACWFEILNIDFSNKYNRFSFVLRDESGRYPMRIDNPIFYYFDNLDGLFIFTNQKDSSFISLSCDLNEDIRKEFEKDGKLSGKMMFPISFTSSQIINWHDENFPQDLEIMLVDIEYDGLSTSKLISKKIDLEQFCAYRTSISIHKEHHLFRRDEIIID